MNKRIVVFLAVAFIALPLYADFRSVERALRVRLGAPKWIPGLGLMRFAANVIHPNGVHDFQLTLFENGDLDGPDAARMMSREAPGFTPLVRQRERGEWSLIYARPAARGRVELLILHRESDQTVLVRCDVDPQEVGKAIKRHGRFNGRHRGSHRATHSESE